MPRSKELPEDMRKKIIEAHQSGKGYKLIAGALGLQKSTIRSIVRRWKVFGSVITRPRSGRPPKISSNEREKIIQEVLKNPCITPKHVQATLALENIQVHDSTIRKILGVHRRPSLSSYNGGRDTHREEKSSIKNADRGGRDEIKEDERVKKDFHNEPNHGNDSKEAKRRNAGEDGIKDNVDDGGSGDNEDNIDDGCVHDGNIDDDGGCVHEDNIDDGCVHEGNIDDDGGCVHEDKVYDNGCGDGLDSDGDKYENESCNVEEKNIDNTSDGTGSFDDRNHDEKRFDGGSGDDGGIIAAKSNDDGRQSDSNGGANDLYKHWGGCHIDYPSGFGCDWSDISGFSGDLYNYNSESWNNDTADRTLHFS